MATNEAQERWRGVAAGWERRREFVWAASRPVSERLVELLAPEPGDTVLELAAGAGDTGYLAVDRIGPSGRLITSDFVPEIVDSARRRAEEIGLEHIDFRILDAGSLDLPDESVDGVLCRWGFMLVPEPAVAFAETRRVLRPGGRVSFTVWGNADENPWASAIGETLLARELVPPPEPDAPGPFRLGDRDRVHALVEAGGLEILVHEDFPVGWPYGSFDTFWETSQDLSQMLQSALEGLDEAQVGEVRAEVEGRLARYRDGGALSVAGVTQIVLARRPA
jgi:SAM-dependent methyltransferase